MRDEVRKVMQQMNRQAGAAAHTHREEVEGCFRCELGADEVAAQEREDDDLRPGTPEYRADWLEQRHEDMVVLVQQMQERAQRAEADLRRLRKVEKGYRTVADLAWRLRAENNELRALLDGPV